MILFKYSLESLLARRRTVFAATAGVALVAFVLAASLMLSDGVASALGAAGREDVALVLRKGANNELSSAIDASDARAVAVAPGVKRAAAETIVVLALPKLGALGLSNVTVRGTSAESVATHPRLALVAGRAPAPGADEAMIGARVRGRFEGLELGASFELRRNRPVTIVGVFEEVGGAAESEVWMDDAIVARAFGRQGTPSAVRVELTSASALGDLRAAIEGDPRLSLEVKRETDYLREQSETLATFLGVMGALVSGFFSLGAILGAMMTMHAAVAGRTREIGTLRALGFSRRSVLAAVVFESAAMAGAGGAIGAALALALRFVRISMVNYATWSELSFGFSPTPRAIVAPVAVGVVMGLAGGLMPALRATRISPLDALRKA